MKKNFFYLALIGIPLFCSAQQEEQKTKIIKSYNGIIQSVEFSENDTSKTTPESSTAFFKDWLKTSANDHFKMAPHSSKRKEFIHSAFSMVSNGTRKK